MRRSEINQFIHEAIEFLKKAIFICRNGYYGVLRYGKRKVKLMTRFV